MALRSPANARECTQVGPMIFVSDPRGGSVSPSRSSQVHLEHPGAPQYSVETKKIASVAVCVVHSACVSALAGPARRGALPAGSTPFWASTDMLEGFWPARMRAFQKARPQPRRGTRRPSAAYASTPDARVGVPHAALDWVHAGVGHNLGKLYDFSEICLTVPPAPRQSTRVLRQRAQYTRRDACGVLLHVANADLSTRARGRYRKSGAVGRMTEGGARG